MKKDTRTIRPETQARYDAVVALGRAGKSGLGIATELGEHLGEVQRWLKHAGIKNDFQPHLSGRQGEELVLAKLARMGISASLTAHSCKYDIEAENGIRIEVKTCTSPKRLPSGLAAHFGTQSLRKSILGYQYTKNYVLDCEIVVLVCLLDAEAPRFWICPPSALPKSNTTIMLTPSYSKKWHLYENAFHLIEKEVRRAS